MKNFLLFCILFSVTAAAQVPGPAINPMTASGAKGIHINDHILYWQNPSGVTYNQCYFSSDSSLVANMDPSVRIQNGSPSTVYNFVPVNTLTLNTKYFWRIVEYNSSGNSASPVWNFTTQVSPVIDHSYEFAATLEGWIYAGPQGPTNWMWSPGSAAGSLPGELIFRWDPVFIGESYFMSPVIHAPADLNISVEFRFYEDWWSNIVTIGCAYTLDNGNSWTSIWEIQASGNIGPDLIHKELNIPGTFRLGFYYTGNSNDIDFYHIDDVIITNTSAAAYPPSFLKAEGLENELKAILNWNSGSGSITGYNIQRKSGLPTDNSSYMTIDSTDNATFSYEDNSVEAGSIYTYRICSLSPSGHFYGNESTVFVPSTVPVELVSFTSELNNNDVTLLWSTATETNNSGFEIERSFNAGVWQKLGFAEGHGTVTTEQSYSFIDQDLSSGIYNYRLKQLDFDGTFSYSSVIEMDIDIPVEFMLYQNYPNPFNPLTAIRFSLPESGYAVLKIYDILGNEISTLLSGEFEAGNHEIEFHAENISSGIYLYRLTAGKFTSVKKLQVMK